MTSTVETAAPPRMRADASRNRRRIIEAARDSLLETGLDVPLDAIAQRAGVGNATVYRHFPDRAELMYHVALFSFERIAEEAESALAEEPDPFEAIRRFVHRAADERVGSLCSVLADGFNRKAAELVTARRRLEESIEALLERARRSGQLRPDVAIGDLMVAVTQLSRPVPGTGCETFERFARRHLELFLDGLHSPGRSTLPGVAVTFEDLERTTEAVS